MTFMYSSADCGAYENYSISCYKWKVLQLLLYLLFRFFTQMKSLNLSPESLYISKYLITRNGLYKFGIELWSWYNRSIYSNTKQANHVYTYKITITLQELYIKKVKNEERKSKNGEKGMKGQRNEGRKGEREWRRKGRRRKGKEKGRGKKQRERRKDKGRKRERMSKRWKENRKKDMVTVLVYKEFVSS